MHPLHIRRPCSQGGQSTDETPSTTHSLHHRIVMSSASALAALLLPRHLLSVQVAAEPGGAKVPILPATVGVQAGSGGRGRLRLEGQRTAAKRCTATNWSTSVEMACTVSYITLLIRRHLVPLAFPHCSTSLASTCKPFPCLHLPLLPQPSPNCSMTHLQIEL